MPTKHLLYGETDVRSAAQFIFAELLELARPIVLSYTSDLYHDALWLERYVRGTEFSFVWSCDETGTAIGTDEKLGVREYAYRFTVRADGRLITLTY